MSVSGVRDSVEVISFSLAPSELIEFSNWELKIVVFDEVKAALFEQDAWRNVDMYKQNSL